jgi:UDP-N-acetylglucosamine diphosphorylase/glucosamine-1-phosphate N-acetyltransferase
MNCILFDAIRPREYLKPITLTRPVSGIRCGILTISEKWEKYLQSKMSFLTEDYLAGKFPAVYTDDNLYINASFLPNEALVYSIQGLTIDQGLFLEEELIAVRTSQKLVFGFDTIKNLSRINYTSAVSVISELPHIFLNNGSQIESDFDLITSGENTSEVSDKFTAVYNPEKVFIGKNVSIRSAIINAEAGPVYIDDDAVIQEGAIIIGPVAIGKNAMVAFGAKIRSNTTLGPYCRVGGEVGNSVFHAFSNKAHDGFLGNSYVGEWCNLGANTNNSNLKNNYKSVSLYSYATKGLYDTGEVFCGTFIGDYTKVGISTMFNTGTVVGVSSNIYGAGFQDKFVDSFKWGGKMEGYENYLFNKAIEVINATMARRDLQLEEEEIEILKYISENS